MQISIHASAYNRTDKRLVSNNVKLSRNSPIPRIGETIIVSEIGVHHKGFPSDESYYEVKAVTYYLDANNEMAISQIQVAPLWTRDWTDEERRAG